MHENLLSVRILEQKRSVKTRVSLVSLVTAHRTCFSAQPVAATGSRYSVVPHKRSHQHHAEQGDLQVKARREMRVPAGKTLAITAWGKPGEVMRFAGGHEFPFQAIFAGALATGAAARRFT